MRGDGTTLARNLPDPDPNAWARKPGYKPCLHCGKLFTRRSPGEFARAIYCSRTCGGTARTRDPVRSTVSFRWWARVNKRGNDDAERESRGISETVTEERREAEAAPDSDAGKKATKVRLRF